MKCLRILIMALLVSLLSGCWGQHDIERSGADLQLGIERSKSGRILITAAHPVFVIADKKQDEVNVTECDIPREAREKNLQKSDQIPEVGKLQQCLFSTELAREGIYPWLEIFERDPLDPPLATVVVVDGSPRELMEKAESFKDKPRPALYIHDLLENNRDQYAIVNSIIRFNIAYFAPGFDPVAPMIQLEPKGIRLTGSAIFAGDRMVGAIDPNETILLLAIMGRLRGAVYIFRHPAPLPGQGRGKPAAAARIAEVKRKMQIRIRDGHPEVAIRLNFTGVLDEYRWDRMDRPQSLQKLERSFAAELDERANRLVQYLQRVGGDPIGIGDLIRAEHYRYWLGANPESIYKTARIAVQTKFKISRYGAIK